MSRGNPKAKGAPKRKQKRSVDKKRAFLKAFRITCSVTEAAALVGINRSQHYDWLDSPAHGAKYAADFEKAKIEAAQALEDDIVKWARVGLFEPTIYQGEYCFETRTRVFCTLRNGTEILMEEVPPDEEIISQREVVTRDGPMIGVYRRSESLMAKLAAAWMPEKWGNKVAVTGKDGAPLMPTLMEVVLVDPVEDPEKDEAPEEAEKPPEATPGDPA